MPKPYIDYETIRPLLKKQIRGSVSTQAIERAERIRRKAIERGVPSGFVPFDQREPGTGRIRKPEELEEYT